MRAGALLTILLLIPAVSSHAATLVVAPDGSGEYATIQAALSAADSSDVIELMDGVFTGDGNHNIWIYDKAVTIRSQSGDATACIINPGGADGEMKRALSFQSTTPLCVVENITFTGGTALAGGSSDYGGAMKMQYAASPTISGCIFIGNRAGRGGAIFGLDDSAPTITDCVFADNSATSFGGALCFSGGAQTITGCTFRRNTADAYGGAISCWNNSTSMISNCTLYGNSAVEGGSAAWCRFSGSPTFMNTIIAFGTQGAAVTCEDPMVSNPTFYCCDIYGNADGDWVDCIAGYEGTDGNISLDPLFCDAPSNDLTLSSDSPCAAATAPNSECDLIGSQPVGCGTSVTHVCCLDSDCQFTVTGEECDALGGVFHPEWDSCDGDPCVTVVEESTWGTIKAHYR